MRIPLDCLLATLLLVSVLTLTAYQAHRKDYISRFGGEGHRARLVELSPEFSAEYQKENETARAQLNSEELMDFRRHWKNNATTDQKPFEETRQKCLLSFWPISTQARSERLGRYSGKCGRPVILRASRN